MPTGKSKSPVISVNAKKGVVVLDQDDIADTSTYIRMLLQERADGIVYIKAKSDFPTVVGGKINLVANTTYIINANVNIGSDNFVVPSGGNTNIIGSAFNQVVLTYEGAGVMFENSGGIDFLRIDTLTITATGGGTLINPTPYVANPLNQVTILQCLIQGFASVGTWTSRPFINACAFVNNTAGITINDVVDFRVDNNLMFNTSDLGTTFISIGGTAVVTGSLEHNTITTFAGELGVDINSGIAATSNIRLEDNSLRGNGSALDPTGLDHKSIFVVSIGNDGVSDSRTIGSFLAQGNDLETVISAIGEGESNYVDLNLGAASGTITAFADNGLGGTTVTSAAHGQPNEKLLCIAGTTSYNGESELFNVTVNTFDIDIAFVADDATGTWTCGAFAGVDIERWEVVDASIGTLKYIGQETFNGSYFATISSIASGGSARRFKFRVVKSTDNGVTWVDGFAQPNEIKNTVSNTSFIKPVEANTNDLYKMEVANFENTVNITIDTISVNVS